MALLHISDLLRCASSVQWCDQIPLLLHIAVLGLDSLRPSICHHARQVVINIVLLQAGGTVSASQLSNILLCNQVCVLDFVEAVAVMGSFRLSKMSHCHGFCFCQGKCDLDEFWRPSKFGVECWWKSHRKHSTWRNSYFFEYEMRWVPTDVTEQQCSVQQDIGAYPSFYLLHVWKVSFLVLFFVWMGKRRQQFWVFHLSKWRTFQWTLGRELWRGWA